MLATERESPCVSPGPALKAERKAGTVVGPLSSSTTTLFVNGVAEGASFTGRTVTV